MNSKASVLSVLRGVPLFEGLSDDDLLEVSKLFRALKVSKGQVLFTEESEGHQIYVVYEGAIEIQIMTRSSDDQVRRATIATMYPGQFFGELALLEGSTHSAGAIAVEASTLLVLDGPQFVMLCEQNTRIGYRVFHNLSADLSNKLRSATLLLRGQIKWQDGQLSRF